MFGIKKAIKSAILRKAWQEHFTNRPYISLFMSYFKADDCGHQGNIEDGDLGYGWLHYGIIRSTKPNAILCVGSKYGFIPAVLAQACKDNGFGNVYFVDAGYGEDDEDNWTGEAFWQTDTGLKVFDDFHKRDGKGVLQDHINVFVMTTKEFAKKYPELVFDYIYIDGNHSYEGAKFDLKTFWPKLKIGGFFVFHDVNVKERRRDGVYGVHKVWKELKASHAAIELSFSRSGLGVVQKTANRM